MYCKIVDEYEKKTCRNWKSYDRRQKLLRNAFFICDFANIAATLL